MLKISEDLVTLGLNAHMAGAEQLATAPSQWGISVGSYLLQSPPLPILTHPMSFWYINCLSCYPGWWPWLFRDGKRTELYFFLFSFLYILRLKTKINKQTPPKLPAQTGYKFIDLRRGLR